MADGCHSNRDTIAAIGTTFSEVYYKRFNVPEVWGSDNFFGYFPIGPQVSISLVPLLLLSPSLCKHMHTCRSYFLLELKCYSKSVCLFCLSVCLSPFCFFVCLGIHVSLSAPCPPPVSSHLHRSQRCESKEFSLTYSHCLNTAHERRGRQGREAGRRGRQEGGREREQITHTHTHIAYK